MWNNEATWNSVQTGLFVFYVLCAILNGGFALYWFAHRGRPGVDGTPAEADPIRRVFGFKLWAAVAAFYFALSVMYLFHFGPVLPAPVKGFIDFLAGPVVYTSLSLAAFCAVLYWRRFFTHPHIAWLMLNLSLLFSGLAVTDQNFYSIVSKPDNVPIPLLIWSVGFFTWLALRRGVINDERMARGEAPLEKLEDEKVLVWPDLVYTELICMVICTLILVVWAIVLKAPLEQPATSAKAPNPSKAPWYFLGLQEMLVYYDPWMAGVVLPSMIVVGLIAIPYIDYNQQGNGYYTFAQRKFALITFLLGFIILWVTLIVLGTILRGPNWNFFGPFSFWDPHKVDPLNNINVSDIFWLQWLGQSTQGMPIWQREAPGIIIVLLYMVALPPLLAKTVMKGMFVRMGFVRFFTLVTLMQFMAALPLKMILRWTINLKYIVAMPEYFFNI